MTNLMYTVRNGKVIGILNDFDLAAIMKPGARFPARSGWQRTGTIAFMAIDLLSHIDGKLQRWYRHDLESFAWCLLWRMFEHPPRGWLYNGFKAVENDKRNIISHVEDHTGKFENCWAFSSHFMIRWLIRLRDYSQTLSTQVTSNLLENNNINAKDSYKLQIRNAKDAETKDSHHIKCVVDEAKKVACATSIPALEDTSWIDVEPICLPP